LVFYFYPYLFNHIPFGELQNKYVLEVGLGYGTVSKRLAESEVNYHGFDIAAGSVNMVNHRLQQNGLDVRAVQGSISELSFQHKIENIDRDPLLFFGKEGHCSKP
jgi:2-polyprenyl-3-methyl-5-hydroxy-6-metoxy-1,4-benzoquinol methylase